MKIDFDNEFEQWLASWRSVGNCKPSLIEAAIWGARFERSNKRMHLTAFGWMLAGFGLGLLVGIFLVTI